MWFMKCDDLLNWDYIIVIGLRNLRSKGILELERKERRGERMSGRATKEKMREGRVWVEEERNDFIKIKYYYYYIFNTKVNETNELTQIFVKKKIGVTY